MSPLAFYRELIGKGVAEAVAYELAEKFEADRDAELQARIDDLLRRLSVDVKAEARRAKDRQRKVDAKAGIPRNSAESAESSGIPRKPEPPQDAPAPTCARVEDISPRLVINNQTTPDCECAWPESDTPTKADLERLGGALREAAGAALHAISPRLFDLSPILRLARHGAGPPCDLQADVLPTIRARSARAPPGTVKSWDFYRDAITEARDRRLSGAPAQEPRRAHDHPTDDKLSRKQANLSRAFDASRRVAGYRGEP